MAARTAEAGFLALRVLLLVCVCCLSASRAFADGTDQVVADPNDPTLGYYFRYHPTDAQDIDTGATAQNVQVQITCTAMYDSIRNINSDPVTGILAGQVHKMYNDAGRPFGYSQGAYAYVRCRATDWSASAPSEGTRFWSRNPPNGTFPGLPNASPALNGYYLIKWTVTDTAVHTGSVVAWLIAGSWSVYPPQPSITPPAPPIPGNQTWSGAGNMNLTVIAPNGNPATGLLWQLVGQNVTHGSLDAHGKYSWTSYPEGQYALMVYGNVISADGTRGVSTEDFVQVSIKNAETTDVTIWLGDDGRISRVIGGDIQGGNYSQGEGFWAGIGRSLFIPSSSNVDALKSNLSSWYTWGPFNLLNQFTDIANTASNRDGTREVNWQNSTQLPLPGPVISVGEDHVLHFTGMSDLPSGPGGVSHPNFFAVLTSFASGIPIWSTIRGLMGAGIYVGVIVTIIKRMTPQQTA